MDLSLNYSSSADDLITLCCPYCTGGLRSNASEIVCLKCSRGFPIIHDLNVVDFLNVVMPDDFNKSYSIGENVNLLYKNASDLKTRIDFFLSRLKINLGMPELEKYLLEHKNVLEIGCGTLDPLLKVAYQYDNSHHITGIDVAIPLLVEARRNYPQAKLYRCDAAKMPFLNRSFDLIWARHMLYHTESPAEVVQTASQALDDGGIFCATTNSEVNKEEMHEFHRQLLKIYNIQLVESKRDSSRFSAEGGEEIIRPFFKYTLTLPYNAAFEFTDSVEFAKYYMSTGYFKRFVSDKPGELADITEDVLALAEEMSLTHLSNNGAIIIGTHTEYKIAEIKSKM